MVFFRFTSAATRCVLLKIGSEEFMKIFLTRSGLLVLRAVRF